MKPRILIDATPVTDRVDGLSVYILNLIGHLPVGCFAEFDFTVLLNEGVHPPELSRLEATQSFTIMRARVAPIGPRQSWDLWRFLGRHRGSFDLVHIASSNYPFGMKGGVCTIHDVTFRQWFDGKPGRLAYAFLAQRYMAEVVRNCLRRADAIIAVSQATKTELREQFDATEEQLRKVHVVHEGWEHLVEYERDVARPVGAAQRDYLFFLGSYRVHKNLPLLIEGFRRAASRIPPAKKLVISGSSDKLSAESRRAVDALNEAGSRVVFTGYLSNADVARYYQGADAFIFPSLSEGFGIPVLEAFHFGAPILCSDRTALPEVAGDAALYFDPEDADSIADAIVRFYADPALGDAMRARGKARLEQFSWAKAANETVDVYRRVLKARLG